jgi:hypothetical protein
LRSRFTHSDLALQDELNAFRRTDTPMRIRRRLERPFGSVRWRAETPDARNEPILTFEP